MQSDAALRINAMVNVADAFGIETLIAVELHRDDDGWYTGAIAGTPSFREGKITRVEQWLATLGLHKDDFAQTRCYSDSPNDLPLLEWVSHPVATNPSAQLATIAEQRGWPVLRLFTE